VYNSSKIFNYLTTVRTHGEVKCDVTGKGKI
jgi:hypothetical protein